MLVEINNIFHIINKDKYYDKNICELSTFWGIYMMYTPEKTYQLLRICCQDRYRHGRVCLVSPPGTLRCCPLPLLSTWYISPLFAVRVSLTRVSVACQFDHLRPPLSYTTSSWPEIIIVQGVFFKIDTIYFLSEIKNNCGLNFITFNPNKNQHD